MRSVDTRGAGRRHQLKRLTRTVTWATGTKVTRRRVVTGTLSGVLSLAVPSHLGLRILDIFSLPKDTRRTKFVPEAVERTSIFESL